MKIYAIYLLLPFMFLACKLEQREEAKNPYSTKPGAQYTTKPKLNWDLNLSFIDIHRAKSFNRTSVMNIVQFFSVNQEQINDFWYNNIELKFKMDVGYFTLDQYNRLKTMEKEDYAYLEMHIVTGEKAFRLFLDKENLVSSQRDIINHSFTSKWRVKNHLGQEISLKVEVTESIALLSIDELASNNINNSSVAIFDLQNDLCSLSTSAELSCNQK